MPSFISSTASRLGVAGQDPQPTTATEKQLMLAPYLCVSYEKEEEVYQPARVAGIALGLLSLVSATKVPDRYGLLKAGSALTGLYLMGYNSVRFLEVKEEIERYRAELEGE
jgi:hypothetical protein